MFKDKFLIILQSERMLNILYAYPEHIFIDSTFKVCPQPFYQLLVIRVYDIIHNSFHTVVFALMTNKTRFLYMKVLIMLKINFKKLKKENLDIRVCHCDFDEALSLALLKCFPSTKIKYCFFHYGQILYRKITSFEDNGLNFRREFSNSKNAKKLF